MRPVDVKLIHDSFLRNLQLIERRFNRICSSVSRKGKRQVQAWAAEMSLVNAATAWERYLIHLLIGHITNSPDQFRKELDLPDDLEITKALADAVLTGRRYLEIPRFQEVQRLANDYLDNASNPFTRIDQAQAKGIDAIGILRNHIVHDSRQSKKRYNQLLRREHLRGYPRKPRFFLIAQKDGRPRLVMLLDRLRKGVRRLR